MAAQLVELFNLILDIEFLASDAFYFHALTQKEDLDFVLFKQRGVCKPQGIPNQLGIGVAEDNPYLQITPT